jgi:hypothetical protein
MMPHKHGSLGRNIVNTVFHRMGRCRDVPLSNAPLFYQPSAIQDVAAKQHSHRDKK